MHNNIKKNIKNYLLVILGTFIISFGSVLFLSECEIVNGGINGIAVIIQHYVPGVQIYDILTAALIIFFWLIGLIFVGKEYALKTLLSSLLYIGFTFLFKRVPFFIDLAHQFAGPINESTGMHETGNLILCGIFGGVCAGGGVGIAFLGGGSTGGVDVIMSIVNKYFKVKESVTSIIIEVTIIFIGMVSMQLWIPSLCGIICAVITALLIDAVYNRTLTSYQVDIISDKWEMISWFAQDQLGRGATIIKAQGGYKGDERTILRIVFDKSQYEELKAFISKVDPKAFVTFTQTNAVYGEGFANPKKVSLSKLKSMAKKEKKQEKNKDLHGK